MTNLTLSESVLMLIIHRNVLVGLARLSELEVGGRPAFSMVLTACLMTPSRYNTFVPCKLFHNIRHVCIEATNSYWCSKGGFL
jgi:hypothetical protein